VLTYQTSHEGSQEVQARSAPITTRERKRIEYFNYLGLARGLLRDRQYYRSTR
jgi:hypothetical protein